MEPRIVVIGGSAGSLSVVMDIVRSLPKTLNAAIFLVIHSNPRQKSEVPGLLNNLGGLPAQQAEEGMRINDGEIYVAPPDQHLLIAAGHLHLSRGPKEGLNRPSINVTFRSAAMTYKEGVIGVLLSGMLDDGAAGLWEIARRGGITIVQDPDDAKYSSMPLNALRDAPVEYRLCSHEIGPTLAKLVTQPRSSAGKQFHAAEGHLIITGFTCPECRGPLFEDRTKKPIEFRCRVGHAMSLRMMLNEAASTQERKMYEAMVALQEGADSLEYAIEHLEDPDVEALRREGEQLRNQAEAIRKMIEERVMSSVS